MIICSTALTQHLQLAAFCIYAYVKVQLETGRNDPDATKLQTIPRSMRTLLVSIFVFSIKWNIFGYICFYLYFQGASTFL